MLLNKRKTNSDTRYLKELRLAQDSSQMIWRCLGYWGTLSKMMWKNSEERSYSFGILGLLRFNIDKCKVMRISKKTNTVVSSQGTWIELRSDLTQKRSKALFLPRVYSVLDCFIPSCGCWWKWVTLDRPSVRWCSQLHLISSLAVPSVSKSWSGVKESVACVAGGIIVPGVLSWRRTCHSKRVNGENHSLTFSQSSRGFTAKKLQHSRLDRQLRKLRRVWVSVPFFEPIPSISSLNESPLYEFGTPCMVIILEYEQSLFFLNSPSSKTRETSKWTWA